MSDKSLKYFDSTGIIFLYMPFLWQDLTHPPVQVLALVRLVVLLSRHISENQLQASHLFVSPYIQSAQLLKECVSINVSSSYSCADVVII